MTKKEWAGVLIKTAVFLLIGVLLFQLCARVLMEKSAYPQYRSWRDQENVDILILGNSHAANGLRAADMTETLSEAAGGTVDVFNYSVAGMRMEQMYFFAKELLKTRTPDLIVLETYAFCPLADEHREILARMAFDVFPLSANKIEGIRYCVLEDRSSYYIPFIKYHTRWKELTARDLQLLVDPELWPERGSNGIVQETALEDPGDGWFSQTPPEELQAITPSEAECFERLLDLLEEKDIPLVLVSLPFRRQMGVDSIQQIKVNNYLREHYVDGDAVQLLDMNRMWDELDFDYADLFDEGHANAAGADKVTACLLDYLEANCALSAMARKGR